MNRNTVHVCEKCEHQLCAHRVPILSTLDFSELGKVTSLIVRRKYLKGELILTEGSKSESLIIINSGKVKVFRYTPEGKEQILYIFSEGDFFGEKSLLSSQVNNYDAEALEETHICMIHKKDFQQLLRSHPDISFKLMEELCRRQDRLENAVQGMGTKSIESRVSAVLLEFAEKYGHDTPKGLLVELPLSREGIANYIGVARETVSRKLSLLNDEGVIEVIGNKRVAIIDKKALEESL